MKENRIIVEKDLSEGVMKRSVGRIQEIEIISLEESLESKKLPKLKCEKQFLEREEEIVKKIENISQKIETKENSTIMLDMNQDGIPDDKNERDQALRIREKKMKKLKKKKKNKERNEECGREFPY